MIVVPEGLTPVQVANVLHVRPQTVRKWIRLGTLAGFRVGGRIRVRHDELQRFVERGIPSDTAA